MPSQSIPFCGPTYSDKTLNANAQRSINLYPMKTVTPQASSQKLPTASGERIIMYPTPGYKWAQTVASYATAGTAIRGLFVLNTTLYIVVGNTLVSFVPEGYGNDLTVGTFTKLGTLNTSSGLVSITCNTVNLVIGDALAGYTYTFGTATFATISGGVFPSSGGVTNFTYYDGYIIGAIEGTKKVIQSDVLDATIWGSQAFDEITSFFDNIVVVFSDELSLYIFSPKLCEVQYDVGSFPYAFQKQAGVLIQTGCAAVNSIQKIGNTIMWLASDARGKAFVAVLRSYAADCVSTPPINEAFERYSKVNDAYAYTYREGDNEFYVITFPTAGATWAYDIKMQMWHERSINGGQDLPQCYINWQGLHVVGDLNGNLYIMSQNYAYYSTYNNGVVTDTPMTRVRTCQHLNADGRTVFIGELWVDMQTGTGFISDPNLATQPTVSQPLANLEISQDYGHSWIGAGTKNMGATGQYQQRVRWTKLGRYRQNATFRLTITDPVQTYILGARANIKVGVK